jgi:hypothetical protein
MEQFRKGDFIRLKNLANYQVDRSFDKEVNIFEILVKDDNYVEVRNCKSKIPIADIEPIPINGKDDLQIYYHPNNRMAIYVNPNDPAPIHKIDKSYYYDAFKGIYYLDKNYQEIMKEQGFQYVHEIQHYIFEELDHDRLMMTFGKNRNYNFNLII